MLNLFKKPSGVMKMICIQASLDIKRHLFSHMDQRHILWSVVMFSKTLQPPSLLDRWTPAELSNCDDYAKAGNHNFCYDGWDKLIKSQKSSGVIEVKDFKGFDVRYLVKGGKSLNLQDSDLEVKSNTRGDLLKGFRKFASNKSQSRVFVQKFIPQVA